MSAKECISAARGYVMAASVVAEAAAKQALVAGKRDLSYQHQALAVTCAKLGADLSLRLRERESSPDDLRAAMNAVHAASEVVHACEESLDLGSEADKVG